MVLLKTMRCLLSSEVPAEQHEVNPADEIQGEQADVLPQMEEGPEGQENECPCSRGR